LWTDPSLRVITMKPLISTTSPPLAASQTSTSRSSSSLLPSTSGASPLLSSTTPPASLEPSPTDLLLATPPTLLKLFALVAPFLNLATYICQLITWENDKNFWESLLLLLSWWGVCLFGRWIVQYGFNLSILVFVGIRYFSTASKQVTGKSTTSTSSSSSSSTRNSRPPTLTPAAYSQLLTSSHFLFTHLQALRTQLLYPLAQQFSFTPLRPSIPAPAYSTARLALTSYPFYLLVTYLVPLRYIFLLIGSVGILWNAPFFTTLRGLVWRSAGIRWVVRVVLSLTLRGGKGFKVEWERTRSGVGLPGLVGKKSYKDRDGKVVVVEEKIVKTTKRQASIIPASTSSSSLIVEELDKVDPDHVEKVFEQQELEEEEAAAEESEEDVEVQFTVFENQRWWVGLDWTHALLPGERASWYVVVNSLSLFLFTFDEADRFLGNRTDPSSNPSNPPSSFTLPSPQITYIPSPTPSDSLSKLRKVTSWKWLDSEWRVLREPLPLVSLPTISSSSSSPLPPSPPLAPSSSPVTTSSKLFSSLPSPPSSLLPSSSSSSPITPASFSSPSSLISDSHSRIFEHWAVDQEGWQYGDNHFEKMGPKGGLGRYTRRRAWVRRAGLVERTERVEGVAATGEGAKKKDSEREKVRRRSENKGISGSVLVGENRNEKERDRTSSSIRKRKSMPPIASAGSERSISKDVD